MNLALAFEGLAAAYPDREAIVQGTRRLGYGVVAERARRLASVLAAHGYGVHRERATLRNHESGQDHVGLYLLNSPEYIEGMLGCFRARVAPFNVNYRYVDEELLYLLEDSDAVGLVYHARFAPTLTRIRERLPRLRLLLQVADGSGEPLLPGALDYEAALAAADPRGPDVAPSPDDLYVLYTGGTTGAPKGVLWRQEDIYFGAMTGRPPGGPAPDTVADLVAQAEAGAFMRLMPAPPLMHGAAQWLAFGCLHTGGTVVLQTHPEHVDPADIWRTVEREKVILLVIVGDAFARPLLDELERGSYDLSGLFFVASGGALLSAHHKAALIERLPHVTVIDGFGASETGAQGTHASRAGEGVTTGSFAMANTHVLSEDLTRVVAPGSTETGWLAKSGHVPLGYYKDPAKTAKTFPVVGGTRYAVPGDHAHYRPDGSISVLGRGSVCINTGGEKVYPEEVEQVLRRHPAVYDAVVVGTPDERFGEQVTAVVQPRPGTRPTAEELVAFAGEHLARYKLPKTTVMVDELVRSPSGKPDYRWARSRALVARGLPAS
ncbi:MAG TPA: acyl-CoA synthetase [Candidatus Binatia bacterium]|jgi:acyl-CoA synthetase (AMP-forming)/AMP-acid ligase II|nr:acyl-CoA synthetase [Candidatus Binatia bacterium]